MEKKDVPVLLLTGYLGSGKTTLVNRILGNRKGIKFAVIVNDIGEVNIDADLIQAGGVVAQKDDSLVALQNGCICCTLKADLVAQVFDLMKSGKFDYIVIEAISNLIIQQIEFCNIILLNKASEVKPEELEKIRTIIRTLQPGAEIIDCNYADVDLDKILDTKMFNFDKAAMSAGWIRGIESRPTDEEEEEARNHGHHHHHHHHDGEQRHCHEEGHGHHHHHHDEGEAEEYGISTFVYYRRPAFDINKFDYFVTKKWPKSVIRAKGICYFSDERGMSYLFEQAGSQKQLRQSGQWYATAPEEDLIQLMQSDPGFMRDWDAKYGDRMEKIVFIGQKMDKEQIIRDLDDCLEDA